jgi:hypothetical protein
MLVSAGRALRFRIGRDHHGGQQPNLLPMKSFRILLVLAVCATFAGVLARADTTPAKDQTPPAKSDKACCDKSADKACCDKADDKACDKTADKTCCCKDKEPMQCCVDAAKAGKVCEKCNPPAKK